MNNKNLILIGGGGHCKSVIDVAENAGYTILGILDTPENLGKKVLNYQIVGTDENIRDYVDKAFFLVTVGQIQDPTLRIKLHAKVYQAEGHFATLIANTAHVSNYSSIGEGTVIMHQAVVNADARIGIGCIINTFANIEHDVVINDFCHISTGAMINGNCTVGKGTFFGSQSVIVNGLNITEGCVIAAGALVRKDILQKGIYAGIPATLQMKL
jgi:sugar O-acyltransferase (sialic acid O-acetyltransferase NeuD family)